MSCRVLWYCSLHKYTIVLSVYVHSELNSELLITRHIEITNDDLRMVRGYSLYTFCDLILKAANVFIGKL